jgi:sirohydrochlorin ferrochelatase
MTGTLARDVAVVIAAHGDRGGSAPNARLIRHRDTLIASGGFRSVTMGVLNGEPGLEAALEAAAASAPAEILVFPFFMAAGHFTETVLPDRIGKAGHGANARLLAPLGHDPSLPRLMLAEATAAASRAGFLLHEAELIIAGHGSRSGPASALATKRAAEALGAQGSFARVSIGLLEEPPFLFGKLAAARGAVVVSGFFSGEGLHAGEDVPEAIRACGARAVYAGAIGASPAIADLIRDAVMREMPRVRA